MKLKVNKFQDSPQKLFQPIEHWVITTPVFKIILDQSLQLSIILSENHWLKSEGILSYLFVHLDTIIKGKE
jgi:hypothetical protein